MKLTDIFRDGMERDIALKRANEASAPAGPLVAGMAVDDFSGALRALRSGRGGSLSITPGHDYGKDLGDPITLFDQVDIPTGVYDSMLFDTLRWDWMLLTVQCHLTQARGLPISIEVYGLASLLTADLVFAHPLFGEGAIQTFVIPVMHPTHLVRVLVPINPIPSQLNMTAQRLPPGYPIASTQVQHTIANLGAFDEPVFLLTRFFDRSSRGFVLEALVSAVANPTTRIASLEVVPWTGQCGVPLWNVPLGRLAPVHTVARVPNQGPVCINFRTTGAAGPTWTLTVDFTPIYAG